VALQKIFDSGSGSLSAGTSGVSRFNLPTHARFAMLALLQDESPIVKLIADIFGGLLVLGAVLWLTVRSLKGGKGDAGWLIAKWIMSAIVVGAMAWLGRSLMGGGYSGLLLIPIAGLAWILGILWAPSLAGMVAQPFGDLYDGGEREVDATPHYSAAIARRQAGQFNEAITLVRGELERFPKDFEGQMLLASIQAENLSDLSSAQVSVERILNQEGHAPKNLAYALTTLADWHLTHGQDPDSAKLALERIGKLFPDTEASQIASQRLAHLTTTEQLFEQHNRPAHQVRLHERDIGLRGRVAEPKPPENDPAKEAAAFITHLQQHPLDWEAREKLALIYAEHYQRLDLAAVELEQLISTPNQPAKQLAHWLNLLADLQVRLGRDLEAARKTLQRIVDLFPKTAAAAQAQTAMNYLAVGKNPKDAKPGVVMAAYERDLGLTGKLEQLAQTATDRLRTQNEQSKPSTGSSAAR
jgi:TolA-binding protein